MPPAPKPALYAFDKKFLAWLRRQSCAACGLQRGGFEAIEAAHIDSCRYGDVGNAIPLCGSSCHRDGPHAIHQVGKVAFAKHHHLELRRLAWGYVEWYNREHGQALGDAGPEAEGSTGGDAA